MEKEIVLEAKNLSTAIKERFLIKDVNFSVEKGEIFGIFGEDGSGKTSLIKAFVGAMPISDGQALVFGKDVKENPSVLSNLSIALDPPAFFKFQSVLENVKYLTAFSAEVSDIEILRALRKFGLIKKTKSQVLFLSSVERKMLSFAIASLTRPNILILDEPFKNLPEKQMQVAKYFIEEMHQLGTTLILTSKNLDSIEPICDRIMFMQNREVAKIFSKQDLKLAEEGEGYAFVATKYPHYLGSLLIKDFDLKVKIYQNKVLFDGVERDAVNIVRYASMKKIEIYKAGIITKKSERIFTSLAPYYKEEKK